MRVNLGMFAVVATCIICGGVAGVVYGGFLAGIGIDVPKWIGVVSAMIAAGAAIGSLVIINRKFALQRQQTAYAIGDAPPTFEWDQARNAELFEIPSEVELMVTNNNRRQLYIERIAVSPYPIEMTLADISAGPFNFDDRTEYSPVEPGEFPGGSVFEPNYPVPGWHDKNTEPSRAIFELNFYRSEGDTGKLQGNEIIEVDITYRLVGDGYKPQPKKVVIDVGCFKTRDEAWTS